MPLIASAYLALLGGLLVGFETSWLAVALIIATVVALVAALRRDPRGLAVALLFGGGVLLAGLTQRRDERCSEAMARARSWDVVASERVAPGNVARAAVLSSECSVAAMLLVEEGRAAPGDRLRVVGRAARARNGGIVVRGARVRTIGRGSRVVAVRAALGERIDRLFGADAPLARALLIADERSIDPEVRARFADAGIVHMLSVSGLHVGIIAAAVSLLFAAMRMPAQRAAMASLLATAAYVVVIGAPASAVRSAAMLGVVIVAKRAQRPVSPWGALALGGLLPLVDPRAATEVGYQLSVLGVGSLIAAGSLSRRILAPRLGGWQLRLARDVITGLIASFVSMPLVAWTFGRVSLVAPLANIAAAPIFLVLQPTLFLALVVSPVTPLAHVVADAAHVLLWAVDGVARVAASVPLASLGVAPTLVGVAGLAGASAALLVACVSRFPGRALVAFGAGLCAAVWLPLGTFSSGLVELHMLDVGQGDALALRTARGRWLLFDTGRSWEHGDAGRSTVIPYVRRRGGDVVGLVLTHPHSDHVGGAASTIRALEPSVVWDGGYVAPGEPYREALEAARERGVTWRRVHPGDSLSVDGVAISFLAPDSAWAVNVTDPNEASAVALARVGEVRFLLVGDAEAGEEGWLLARGESLRADVLKVGHHGSATSSGAAFLDSVRPSVALISVGAGNSYGHPDPEVVRALRARGAEVLRTDLLGSIVVRTDGRRILLETHGETWEHSRASLPP